MRAGFIHCNLESMSDPQHLRPLSPWMLARLRRAKDGVYSVENALRAFSTLYTHSSERRRREPVIMIEIREAQSSSHVCLEPDAGSKLHPIVYISILAQTL